MQGLTIFAGVGFLKGGKKTQTFQECTNLPCAKTEGEKGRVMLALHFILFSFKIWIDPQLFEIGYSLPAYYLKKTPIITGKKSYSVLCWTSGFLPEFLSA